MEDDAPDEIEDPVPDEITDVHEMSSSDWARQILDEHFDVSTGLVALATVVRIDTGTIRRRLTGSEQLGEIKDVLKDLESIGEKMGALAAEIKRRR